MYCSSPAPERIQAPYCFLIFPNIATINIIWKGPTWPTFRKGPKTSRLSLHSKENRIEYIIIIPKSVGWNIHNHLIKKLKTFTRYQKSQNPI